jgi:FkbM family methyltransferase
VRTTSGDRLVVPARDLSLTPYLALSGSYEGNFAAYLARRIAPGDTVVDVGANIGLFTVRLADLVGEGGRVYAYECNAWALEYLADNVAMNWFDARVVTVAAAAGAADGVVQFAAPESMLMLGTTRLDLDVGAAEIVEVPCERIDGRIPDGVRVELVKIDVEGAEVDVVAGLAGLLDEERVGTIALELNDRQGSRWDEMSTLLTELHDQRGARFHSLDDRGRAVGQSLMDVLTVADYGNLIIDFPSPGPGR